MELLFPDLMLHTDVVVTALDQGRDCTGRAVIGENSLGCRGVVSGALKLLMGAVFSLAEGDSSAL